MAIAAAMAREQDRDGSMWWRVCVEGGKQRLDERLRGDVRDLRLVFSIPCLLFVYKRAGSERDPALVGGVCSKPCIVLAIKAPIFVVQKESPPAGLEPGWPVC